MCLVVVVAVGVEVEVDVSVIFVSFVDFVDFDKKAGKVGVLCVEIVRVLVNFAVRVFLNSVESHLRLWGTCSPILGGRPLQNNGNTQCSLLNYLLNY